MSETELLAYSETLAKALSSNAYNAVEHRLAPHLFNMITSELKILLFTSQLAKIQAFYSAIGMNWVGGPAQKIDESYKPDKSTDIMGLPFLIGDLGNVEFNVHFRIPSVVSEPCPTEILIRFAEIGDASRAIEHLKFAGLFVPGPNFDQFNLKVMDPDGRPVVLCDPSPFS